jgi:hypothetical protein
MIFYDTFEMSLKVLFNYFNMQAACFTDKIK